MSSFSCFIIHFRRGRRCLIGPAIPDPSEALKSITNLACITYLGGVGRHIIWLSFLILPRASVITYKLHKLQPPPLRVFDHLRNYQPPDITKTLGFPRKADADQLEPQSSNISLLGMGLSACLFLPRLVLAYDFMASHGNRGSCMHNIGWRISRRVY